MSLSEQEHRDLVASLPRAHRQPVYVVALLACIAIAGAGFVMLISAKHGKGPNVAGAACIGAAILGAAVVVILLVAHLQRVRKRSLVLVAERLGLEHVLKPAREARAALFAPFAGLKMLRSGARGLKMWFGGEMDGRRVDLIEHQYIVSTGKSAHVVTHTAAVTPAPAAWPRVSLTSRNVLASWWASVRGNDFKVENEAFNSRWIVKTEDPGFALLFLTPEVQEFLSAAPSAETWHVGDGSLCWLVRKQLKPRDLPMPPGRLVALRNLLPPELDVWQPG